MFNQPIFMNATELNEEVCCPFDYTTVIRQ